MTPEEMVEVYDLKSPRSAIEVLKESLSPESAADRIRVAFVEAGYSPEELPKASEIVEYVNGLDVFGDLDLGELFRSFGWHYVKCGRGTAIKSTGSGRVGCEWEVWKLIVKFDYEEKIEPCG